MSNKPFDSATKRVKTEQVIEVRCSICGWRHAYKDEPEQVRRSGVHICNPCWQDNS